MLRAIYTCFFKSKNSEKQVSSSFITNQSGNIFFTLFGAVAVVGLLGTVVMSTMRGPLSTMVEVQSRAKAESEMAIGSRLALLEATELLNDGDCDSDGFVEPLEYEDAGGAGPTGGGFLPTTVASSRIDPWGTEYGYCAWDAGGTVGDVANCDYDGSTALERLNGNVSGDETYTVIALISAGPDQVFNTTCTGGASPAVTKAGDDMVVEFTYAEATASTGGLWNIKSGDPSIAQIDKDIEVDGGAEFSGGISVAPTSTGIDLTGSTSAALQLGAASMLFPTQGDLSTCNAANNGLVRVNTTINPNRLEICSDSTGGGIYGWASVAGADVWLFGAGDDIYYDATTPQVGIGNNNPSEALDVTGNIAATGNIIAGGNLGGVDLAASGNATVGGTLGVTGATTLSTLNATGAVDFDSTFNADGATTLGSTLNVTGVGTFQSNIDVQGSIQNSTGDVTVGDNLIVVGTSDLLGDISDSLGDLRLADNVVITGTLDAQGAISNSTGNVDVSDNLDVTGDITGTDISASSDLSAGSTVMVNGDQLGPPVNCTSSQKLEWNNGSGWSCETDLQGGSGGGVPALDDLTDVTVPTPSDGECLIYDNGSGDWINAPCTGVGAGIWEIVGNVARIKDAAGDWASDDFVFGSPQLADDGDTDHDSRMFFDKSKSAFRAGGVAGAHWDDAAVGSASFVFGLDSTASGTGAITLGSGNVNGGTGAVVLGNYNYSIGSYSTVFGINSGVSGASSASVGLQTVAHTVNPLVSGDRTIAFFMDGGVVDANSGVDITGTDLFAVVGGRALIDPTRGEVNVSTGDQQLELDVEGDVGAINYCDEDGDNCFAASDVGVTIWTDLTGGRIHYGTTSANQVGVGTSNPQTTLDVNGGVRVGSVSGGAAPAFMNLDDLGDVSAAAPSNGECLVYNNVSGDWENAVCASGSNLGIFEIVGNVIRVKASAGDYVNDDFVIGSPQLADTADPNNDLRMFFDKSKGAFRVGGVAGTQWDDGNIGLGSVAFNNDTIASGATSAAFGVGTTASGAISFTAGTGNEASGIAATALGFGNEASGTASLAIGAAVVAGSGTPDATIGNGSGNATVAVGLQTAGTVTVPPVVTGDRSFGIFMDQHTADYNSGYDLQDDDMFAIVGGTYMMDSDPSTPASRGCLQYNDTSDTLQFSNDCTTYYDIGAAGGSVALDDILAADAASTIANSAFTQTWQWQFTGAGGRGMTFSESAASTGGADNQFIVVAAALPSSTAIPLAISNLGDAPGFYVSDEAADTSRFIVDEHGNVGIGVNNPNFLLEVGTAGSMLMTLNNSVATNDDPYNLNMGTGANSPRRFTLATEEGTNRAALQFGDGSGGETLFGIAHSTDSGASYDPYFVVNSNGAIALGGSVVSVAGDQVLEVDVHGDIGAVNYCDEDGNDCFQAGDVASGANIFEVTGGAGTELVRQVAAQAPLATSDFVFGGSSLDNQAGADDDARMFFDKSKAAFRAAESGFAHMDDANVGSYSAAFGSHTTASGSWSFAAGQDSGATANYATVFGYTNLSSGNSSFSVGSFNNASGADSVAMGREATASGASSMAFGASTAAQTTDPVVSGARSVGIFMDGGVADATSGLDMTATDTFMIYGGDFLVGSYQMDDTTSGNEDNRMFFDRSKGAFRAGTVEADEWDDGNVGTNSTAFGYDNTASGPNAFAVGYNNYAVGDTSVALGASNYAGGENSIALGYNVSANTDFATAMGQEVIARSVNTFAISLADQNDTDANRPEVSGSGSMGIFMDTVDDYDLSATDTFAIIGGELMIDEDGTSAASRGCIRYNDTDDELQYSDDCSSYTSFVDLAGSAGIFERNGTVVRGAAGAGYVVATDDFVFGSTQLADTTDTDHDRRMFFDKSKGAFRAGYETGAKWDDANVGVSSFAVGEYTQASGLGSAAMGTNNVASGLGSFAMGNSNVASATSSTALGGYTLASDQNATALGGNVTASGYSSVAIGAHSAAQTVRPVVSGDRSVGIFMDGGVADATSGFDLAATDTFAIIGAGDFIVGSYQMDDTTTGNEDARMFFDRSKGAFRAGGAAGTQWDDGNVGDWSTAFGNNTTASGEHSFAAGNGATASGGRSIALGNDVVADGQYAVALNGQTFAMGSLSLASGWLTSATGETSTAMGSRVTAGSGTALDGAGDSAFAIGLQTATQTAWPQITGDRSMVLFFDGGVADANSAYDFTENDKFAIIGGEFQIDSDSSTAAKGCIRYNDTDDELQYSDDCSSYTSFVDLAGSAGIFERNGTVIRGAAGNGYVASTDDFVFGSSQLADTGTATDDNRMFFDKSKGAFRAGGVGGTQWDDGNVGGYSVVLGEESTASGAGSVSIGVANTASANGSMAFGTGNLVSGDTSLVFGRATHVTGTNSMGIGLGIPTATEPVVSGNNSFGIFMGDQDSMDVSTANTLALLGGSMVIGSETADADGYAGFKMVTEDGSNGDMRLYAHDNSNGTKADIEFIRSRGTEAAPTIVQDGNVIGTIRWKGYDGTDFNTMAGQIRVEVDGTPGGNNIPSFMGFAVGGNVSETAQPNMVLTESSDLGIFSYTNSAAAGADFNFHRAGNSLSSASVVADGFSLGALKWDGYDGTDFESTARIEAFVDGAPGADTMPSSMRFYTGPTDTAIERMRIAPDGNVGINQTAPTTALHVGPGADAPGNGAANTQLIVNYADNGVLSVIDSSNDVETLLGNWGSEGLVGTLSSNNFHILTNDTARIGVAASGEVGIGNFQSSADTIDSALHIQTGDIRVDGGAGNEAGCIRFDDGSDKLQFSHDCSSYTDMGSGGGSGIFERNGTVVRGASGSGYVASTDDFVFGGSALDNQAGVDDDTRMYLDKSLSAFRAGYTNGTQWDAANTGQYSIALGRNVIASGLGTIAIGHSDTADGGAITSSGTGSVAMGSANGNIISDGFGSFAMGYAESGLIDGIIRSEGTGSFALGFADGQQIIEAAGNGSMAWGAPSGASSAITAAGVGSTAFGRDVTATGDYSVAVGLGASSTATEPEITGTGTMALFMGDQNGVDVTGNDAFVVYGGQIGVDTVDPVAALHLGGTSGALSDGIMFGDGDSGFYEPSDDTLNIALGGVGGYWTFTASQLYTPIGTGPGVRGTTDGNPQFAPNRNDTDTGFGRAGGDDTVAVFAGGNVVYETDTSGNMGLGDFTGGTDTIDSRLHLQAGEIRLDGGAANEAGCIRFDDTTDKIQFSHDCSSYADMGSGGGSGVFERNGTVIRGNTGAGYVASTDDFIFGSSQLADTGTATDDIRMFFDKSKGAFRAGGVTGTQWDDGNVGGYSIALGEESTVSGYNGIALGAAHIVSGNGSAAIGTANLVSGNDSFVIGRNTHVTGLQSMALGLGAPSGTEPVVSGDNSLGIFMGDQVNMDVSTNNTLALLGGSIVIGSETADADNDAFLKAVSEESDLSDLRIYNYDGTGAHYKSDIDIYRARGTEGTPAAVQNNDSLGAYRWFGYDGSEFESAAVIRAMVDGAPATRVPARIEFMVGASGSDVVESSHQAEMVLTSAGDLRLYQQDAGGAAYKADFELYRARGTQTTAAAVQDDDELGTLRFYGHDGTDFETTASVRGIIDGTPANNVMPTALGFYTGPANTGFERMRINPNGNIGLGDFTGDIVDSRLHLADGIIRLDGGAGNQAGCIRFDDTTDKIQFSHDCSSYTDMGSGGGSGLFERNGTVIRGNTGAGYVISSDDFVFGSSQLADSTDPDEDNRFFFDKSKGAFRAGTMEENYWDDGSVGTASTAFGYNTIAGNYSIAAGSESQATGGGSVALGVKSLAQGDFSVALGADNVASGSHSMSIGLGDASGSPWPEVSGNNSLGIFMGDHTNIDMTSSNTMAVMGGDFVVGSYQLADTTSGSQDNRMFFDVSKGSFRVGTASGTQWDDGSVGLNSTVLGYDSTASGNGTTAIGIGHNVSGDNGVAIGSGHVVAGTYGTALGANNQVVTGSLVSTAIGLFSHVSGDSSIAVGMQTAGQATPPVVSGDRSMVLFFDGNSANANSTYDFTEADKFALIGGEFQIDSDSSTAAKGCIRYNDTDDELQYSDDCSSYTSFADLSGGGSGVFERSGTLIRGNTGGGYVISSDDFVFGSSQLADSTDTDEDNRFFFDKSKGAFRAGSVSGTEWDDANVGDYSVAMGVNSRAMAYATIALGEDVHATNAGAIAIGGSTYATANSSTAIGLAAVASGAYSIALGTETTASGTESMAIGLGDATSTPPEVSGNNSLGIFLGDQDSVNISAANVMALMGGSLGIGVASPASALHVDGDIRYTGVTIDASDRRLKQDIKPLSTVLNDTETMIDRLQQVDTYKFRMKDQVEKRGDDAPVEFGVIAQELEKVFPELVMTADDEMKTKSVVYLGLIGPMIEATKELADKNTALEAELSKRDDRMAAIEARMAKLESSGVTGGDDSYSKGMFALLSFLAIVSMLLSTFVFFRFKKEAK